MPLKADRHPFERGDDFVTDASGDNFPACRICGKDRRAHPRRTRAEMAALRGETLPKAERAARPPLIKGRPLTSIAPKHQGRPGKYLETPWQTRLLAIALDRALAAGPDVIGWRLHIRAAETRKAIDLPGDFDPDEMPESPVPAQDGPGAAREAEAAPTPIRQTVPAYAVADMPQRSRARSATRGIRHDRMRELATRALLLGATMKRNGSGHLTFSGGPLTHPLTISTTATDDARSWRNLRATAKRYGLDVAGL